ncbi:hypothetical protein KTS45_01450 [Halomicroarcula limicola]|uniref:Uncharacterized protein n=1 Tax=Haloarcula limicola TaxID=1429915 RepID=A0A8J7Y710_9EURY|nr:hypothetical protein [Halomicroarcula limicola]MBV0922854.1 hypothetical protein [Halomicroarcula limicola]
MARTDDGGYVLVGHARTSGCVDSSFPWVVKVDASGSEEWSRTYAARRFTGIHVVDDGYVVCESPLGTDGEPKLLRLDSNGEPTRTHTPGRDGDWLSSVVQLPDGGLVGAGSMVFKAGPDGNREWFERRSAQDIVATEDGGFASVMHGRLTKWAADGRIEWVSGFGGHDRDDFYSVTQTRDGGYATVGYVRETSDDDQQTRVVRTDGGGDKLWETRFTPRSVCRGIVEAADGGIAVVGRSDEYQAVRLDADGERRWSAQYLTGDWINRTEAIVGLDDGGYVISGTSSPQSEDELQVVLLRTAPESR